MSLFVANRWNQVPVSDSRVTVIKLACLGLNAIALTTQPATSPIDMHIIAYMTYILYKIKEEIQGVQGAATEEENEEPSFWMVPQATRVLISKINKGMKLQNKRRKKKEKKRKKSEALFRNLHH